MDFFSDENKKKALSKYKNEIVKLLDNQQYVKETQ